MTLRFLAVFAIVLFALNAGAALAASEIVGDLLTLSRAAHPHLLRCEPVDLGAIVSATSKEYAAIAARRDVRLDDRVASAIIDGDERRLRELVRNLLENAVRHARSQVSISVRVDGASSLPA